MIKLRRFKKADMTSFFRPASLFSISFILYFVEKTWPANVKELIYLRLQFSIGEGEYGTKRIYFLLVPYTPSRTRYLLRSKYYINLRSKAAEAIKRSLERKSNYQNSPFSSVLIIHGTLLYLLLLFLLLSHFMTIVSWLWHHSGQNHDIRR